MNLQSLMLRTIDRYVIREVIPPFFLSLVIFTFLLEIPPVMRDLEMLVAKGVSWQVAARILLTLIPQALGLTIPMALLTGLLIGLGRLSADREAVALLACGVSPHRLLRPILLMAVIAGAATMYVMIKAIPDANQTFREITFEVIAKKVENDIHPRVFFGDFPGWVLYASDEPRDAVGGWKDVLVADTRKHESTQLYLSARGRLVLNRQERRVDLVLTDGTRYSIGKPGETQTYRFPGDLTMALNPDEVFRKADLPRGLTEKTIAELQSDRITKLTGTPAYSPHPEIIMIEQKFSVPFACVVFAIIGLALGLSVARDGKMGGFVIGIGVIFAYYAIMYLAEAQTQGYYRAIETRKGLGSASFLLAHLARWWPNIVLGIFGIVALIWRDRFSGRQLPSTVSLVVPQVATRWTTGRSVARTGPAPAAGTAVARRRKVVVVVRIPRVRLPAAGLLDQYVSRMYLRVIGLGFLALMGLFYISTFIDASDKLFKGSATTSTVMQLLAYRTPQFVYYVIPIAALLSVLVTFGLLSRTSELTVMKACGISLYRVALPVVMISLLFSAALFSLDQEILARANQRATALDDQIRGRPPRTFNLSSREWLIGRDGTVYHYGFFDSRHDALTSLTVYRLVPGAWRLASQTYATTARHQAGGWTGLKGWTQDFTAAQPKWRAFAQQPLALEPPDYFKTEDTDPELMTVAQLRRSVRELAATGANVVHQQVDLQRKLAFPFVTFVMTLLAVPFGVTTGRRGTLYGIGLGIVLALSYWFVMSVFVAIGKAGLLPPGLAAWTPNVIVTACAIYLLLRAKT